MSKVIDWAYLTSDYWALINLPPRRPWWRLLVDRLLGRRPEVPPWFQSMQTPGAPFEVRVVARFSSGWSDWRFRGEER